MCIQAIERYAGCFCVRRTYEVNRCVRPNHKEHTVEERDVLVEHECPRHSLGTSSATSTIKRRGSTTFSDLETASEWSQATSSTTDGSRQTQDSRLPSPEYTSEKPEDTSPRQTILESGTMDEIPKLRTRAVKDIAGYKRNYRRKDLVEDIEPYKYAKGAPRSPRVESKIGPAPVREIISSKNVNILESLLDVAFKDVAIGEFEWLHDLVDMNYNKREIAELLIEEEMYGPWIFFSAQKRSKSGINTDCHHPGCVHEKFYFPETTFGPNFRKDLLSQSPDDTTSMPPDPNSVNRVVAESCGLAGVHPLSRDFREWFGKAEFYADEIPTVSVTYRSDDQYFPPSLEVLGHINDVLTKLLDSVAWLQEKKLCCNGFTVLRLRKRTETVEVISIPFSILKTFGEALSKLQEDGGHESSSLLRKISLEILDLFYPERDQYTPVSRWSKAEDSLSTINNICALAMQSLCIGLLSYSSGHIGPLQPFFVQRPIKTINFSGIDRTFGIYSRRSLAAELVELTCMGEMLGSSVLVFTDIKKLAKGRKYDLLSSPANLIDMWGPGRFLFNPSTVENSANSRLLAIEIGGGFIRASKTVPDMFHWAKGTFDFDRSASDFDSGSTILIGNASDNCLCPLDQKVSLPRSLSHLETLGTSQDFWKVDERQVALQAGQYVVVQFNTVWVKKKGVTLKEALLSAAPDTIYLPFLDSLWGLQVSLCTGVSRRVPVREMLADVMVAYVEQRFPVPPLWNELLHTYQILDNFRGTDLGSWLSKLPQEMQKLVGQIVRYILEALRGTGFDDTKEEFVIACPLPKNPFRCFRVHCDGPNLWTRALADSTECATFAYITSKCLITSDSKCRNLPAAQWLNQAVSLDTSVCPHLSSKDPSELYMNWNLENRVAYWIGKPGSDLVAKVLETQTCAPTLLSITRSRIPERYRKRMEKVHRIRERHDIDQSGTQVLMLSKK